MTKPASVSMIIPVHNRADLIEETLASVAAQTLPVSEIIVVDDASNDDTPRVVAKWFEEHGTNRGRLWSLPTNVGKPAAVNLALAEVTGEFLVVLDSDDVLEPFAIASQVEFLLRNGDCALVFGLAYELHGHNKTGIVVGGFGLNEECNDVIRHTGDLLLRVNPIVSSSVMIRRSAIDKVGGMNPHLKITHDWDYWMRIARCFRIGYIPTPLVQYRINSPNALTADRVKAFREVCALVIHRPHRFSRSTLLRALVIHLRFNTAVAVKDGIFGQALKILFTGFLAILKLMRP